MFLARDPERWFGMIVGSGHCVPFVQRVSDAPHTSMWRRGEPVTDTTPANAIIATFNAQGRYANALDGSSHAAVFLSWHEAGIEVIDQWVGQPVHRRTIRFRAGQGHAANDASRFHVVEVEDAQRQA